MLDLNNPIVYSPEEEASIQAIMATGKSGNDMWSNEASKELKHRISFHTIMEQGCRCAFCEALLVQGTTAIEHIVPKGKHRRFTFEPLNLVTACGRCNSTTIKGQKDTINSPENPVYSSNSFLIVHPRLTHPDTEIKFTDDTKTVFDKPNCSQLGLDTISFFKWDDEDAVYTRLLNSSRANIPVDVQRFALLISTYK